MKNEQEIIEHAEAMQQAYKDGKKLLFEFQDDNEGREEVKHFAHLLRLLGNNATVTIAPEPKKYWLVVGKDNSAHRFETHATAKAKRMRWDFEFPHSAPHTVEEYVQVLP